MPLEVASQNEWMPDIVTAIRSLGGEARLAKIYEWISVNRTGLSTEWKSVIRATIYFNSSDSIAFQIGNPDVFCRRGWGLWALRHPDERVIGRQNESDLRIEILFSMSPEALDSYKGRRPELRVYLDQRVIELKSKFKIP